MKTDKLDIIIGELNNRIEKVETYYIECEDNMYAEYVLSFAYGEADMDEVERFIRWSFEPEEYEPLLKAMENMTDRDKIQFLMPHVYAECAGMRRIHNEILSVNMEEIETETELSSDIISSLTKEEAEYIRGRCDAYIDDSLDFMYIDMNYKRWILRLDIASALESVEELDNVK